MCFVNAFRLADEISSLVEKPLHSGFISGERFFYVYPFAALIRLPERAVVAFLTGHKLVEFGLPQTIERVACRAVFASDFIGISNAVHGFLRACAVYYVNPYSAVFGVSFIAVSLRFSLIFNCLLYTSDAADDQ